MCLSMTTVMEMAFPTPRDNCTLVPNGPDLPDAGEHSQLDTDGDDYGNVCDCDFNQDDICSIADFNVFLPDFASATASWSRHDMDGDGVVGIGDFNLSCPGLLREFQGRRGWCRSG